ncbi:unnamed protein product [Prunus armeniaca]
MPRHGAIPPINWEHPGYSYLSYRTDQRWQASRHGATKVMIAGMTKGPSTRPSADRESITFFQGDMAGTVGAHESLLDRRCSTLVAFGGSHVQPLGHMYLTISFGVYPRQTSITTDFVMAKCPLSYNVILRRPAIGNLNLSINMKVLLIKFPTLHGVSIIRGDQESPRTCYASSAKLTYKMSCVETYDTANPTSASMVVDQEEKSVP